MFTGPRGNKGENVEVFFQMYFFLQTKQNSILEFCFTFLTLMSNLWWHRFHSLHHTQFRTNYSLFVPMYDHLYGTVDKSLDTLYEKSLERKAELPDVVHLTHLTTPESIYHLRLGFASLASRPHASKWYILLMWPVTLWSFFITWIYGQTFVVERNLFRNIKLQTWAILKYRKQVRTYC